MQLRQLINEDTEKIYKVTLLFIISFVLGRVDSNVPSSSSLQNRKKVPK